MELPAYVTSIGRMAHILVPITKIDNRLGNHTVREVLYNFFSKEFGGFTEAPLTWGFWNGKREAHVEFTVSFEGKHRIPDLFKFLGEICRGMEEECLYLEMGEDAYLVEPCP